VSSVLKKGATVPIRVDDSAQLLSQNEGKAQGAHLLIGVNNAAFGFRQATFVSQDSEGRTYQVLIPFGVAANIVIFSSYFKLGSQAGVAYPKSFVNIPISVPVGQSPPTVEIRVTGGGQ
jgi:hypothetical protein